MSTIAIPSWFCVDGFSMSPTTNQRAFGSPYGGSEQVIDMANDRWTASLSVPPRLYAKSGALEAFVASFRGMTNTINLYHLARPIPRGTLRDATFGAPFTNASAAGVDEIVVWGAVGFTLLAGDLIGVNGMLLQVASDCVADGTGRAEVPLVNRLRRPLVAGAPVTWDRPTAPFRLISRAAVQFVPGYVQGLSLDFVEAI